MQTFLVWLYIHKRPQELGHGMNQSHHEQFLNSIDSDYPLLVALLQKWTQIHSGSDNLNGLSLMLEALKRSFSFLGGQITEIPLLPNTKINLDGTVVETPLGHALSITKRPHASKRVLLAGHMDIAYGAELKLTPTQLKNGSTLIGRGTADMKGGLLVLLAALKAFEKSPYAEHVGWQVLINPDEEIGSPGSAPLFQKAAKTHQFGMIFEPSLPDGSLVSSRKGSSNFTLLVKGKSAHAGRDFFSGRNALTAAARFALAAENLTDRDKEITVNIGQLLSSNALNIIHDRALCRFNIRVKEAKDLDEVKKQLNQIAAEKKEGIEMILHQDIERPPKPFDTKTQHLFETVRHTAQELGFDLSWKPSGGVCDGNILAHEGLPTVDTLGIVGGNLHTEEEFADLKSLALRAKLSALLLMKFASDEFKI